MQARTFKRSAIALAIAGAFAVGADHRGPHIATPRASCGHAAAVAVATTGAAVAALPDFSALVDQYGAAVVNISVTADGTKVAARQQRGMPDMDELPPFFRGMPMPKQHPARCAARAPASSSMPTASS